MSVFHSQNLHGQSQLQTFLVYFIFLQLKLKCNFFSFDFLRKFENQNMQLGY